jgi:hypothetical protein
MGRVPVPCGPAVKAGRSHPSVQEKIRRPREGYEIGWDSDDSEEERWDPAKDAERRAMLGTGEGFFGAPKDYEEMVAILKNRAAASQTKVGRTLSHIRIHKRLRYLQVCAEEQGQEVMDNPPLQPRGMPTKTGLHSKLVTRPYCRAIALSEPVLSIDGESYWSQVASPEIVRRLVHLLAASDSETRLGSSMVLSKFCEGVCKVACLFARMHVVARPYSGYRRACGRDNGCGCCSLLGREHLFCRVGVPLL